METNYREYLRNVYHERKKKNHLYSLRSFARTLDISPATLSQVISGKRNLSLKMAKQIANKLGLTISETKEFLQTCSGELTAIDKFNEEMPDKELLKDNILKTIYYWHYSAILNMAQLNYPYDVVAIAKNLGITSTEVNNAIEVLENLEMIKIENQKLTRIISATKTSFDISSDAIKRAHRNHLDLAYYKLEEVALNEREYVYTTFTVNPNKLTKIKKLIRKFQSELTELSSVGKQRDVYRLGIQLFPLYRGEKDEN